MIIKTGGGCATCFIDRESNLSYYINLKYSLNPNLFKNIIILDKITQKETSNSNSNLYKKTGLKYHENTNRRRCLPGNINRGTHCKEAPGTGHLAM